MSKQNAALNGEWAKQKKFGKRQTSKARRRDGRARRSNQTSASDWWDGPITSGADNSPYHCDCCEDQGCPCCVPNYDIDMGPGWLVCQKGTFERGDYVEARDHDGCHLAFGKILRWDSYNACYEVEPVGYVRGRPTRYFANCYLRKLGLLETLAAVST
jgi:hypothetical protein